MEQYSILARALDDVMTEELNAYLASVDFSVEHRFSEEFERRMQKLIKRREKSYYKLICTAGRRAACTAAVVVLALGFAMSFECVRASVKEFFTKNLSDHIILEVSPEHVRSAPETIEEIYEITELPEGFELVDSLEYPTSAYAGYIFEEYYIDFSQNTKATYRISLDNEHSVLETYVDASGQEYLIHHSQSGRLCVIWSENGYIFEIKSNLDEKTVMDLCRSTKIK